MGRQVLKLQESKEHGERSRFLEFQPRITLLSWGESSSAGTKFFRYRFFTFFCGFCGCFACVLRGATVVVFLVVRFFQFFLKYSACWRAKGQLPAERNWQAPLRPRPGWRGSVAPKSADLGLPSHRKLAPQMPRIWNSEIEGN